MYKVLVVDDEPLMLEGWKTMIDWRAYGYELSGTATDGEEALTRIRACEPDLVFTDIRMPVLDGLGLIRAMKEELGASAKIVIVSGYSEFGYAQQAVRYQVDRYVLKPLVAEEIHELLHELAGPLAERRLAEAAAGRERNAADAAAIVGLLRNSASAEAAARLLGATEQTRCRLLFAESHAAAGGSDDNSKAGSIADHVRLHALAEVCREEGLRVWPFEDVPGRAGLLVLDDGPDEESFEARLKETAARVTWPLLELSLYCSSSAYGLSSLPELYRQTMEMRRRALLGSRAGVHLYREWTNAGECRLEEMTSSTGELLRSVEAGDPERIGGAVDDLLKLFERTGEPGGWFQAAVRHIRGELLRKYAEPEGRTDEAFAHLRQLLCEHDAADSRLWTGNALKRLCIRAAELLADRNAPDRANISAVSEAVAYLKHHFREKIRLQELAERYRLSPVYFGQKFKRETGTDFKEYIHRLRIEEARKLLRRTDMKMSDIAATLGYHDTEYFTDKFKALTGELPSSYKNKCKGDRYAEQNVGFSKSERYPSQI